MGTLSEGSNRLDKTLSLETFAYKDSVSQIVRDHILKSSLAKDDSKEKLGGKHVDEVTQYWSSKTYTFLDELRSASAKLTGKLKTTDETDGHSREWKLKDETERYRVMYREGPEGTPYHTLCLDGVVDGDFASALCVAWEAPLYKEWWPQFALPKFQITESKWLKRVLVGQDLSLLRFKVPWPLAQREVVMSAFEVEYLQDDLLIGLVESVPETLDMNDNVYGFSKADLPPSSANVRMDIGGGFVMQRTSKDQFFFRTILSLDVKLDFVPPWLINFISRQVAGQGLKLYQKAVLAASNGTGSGKAFQKLLKTGQMYDRVRSGFEGKKEANGDSYTGQGIERPPPPKDNVKAKILQGSIRRMGSSEYNKVVPYPVKAETKEKPAENAASITDESAQPLLASAPELHEDRALEGVKLEEESSVEIKPDIAGSSKGVIANSKMSLNAEEHREYDDPEVLWAISILDKMISYTRSCAVEKTTAPQSRESQVESISLDSREAGSKETLVKVSRKHSGPPAKNRSRNILVVKPSTVSNSIQQADNIGSSRSRGLQSAGGDVESSARSGFWSASEIEVVSSQDDTDTDIGASGSSIAGQPKVQEQEVESKRRRRKWRWTCFSPGISRKHGVQGRTNFYVQDSGRAAQAHWRLGESARYTNGRGYHTDGDETHVPRYSLGSRGHSPDRFVTLGELLLDNDR